MPDVSAPPLSALPYVEVEMTCDHCESSVSTWTADFTRAGAAIPLSLAQARAHEPDMFGWCHHGAAMRLSHLVIYAPGATRGDDPLLEWDEDDDDA